MKSCVRGVVFLTPIVIGVGMALLASGGESAGTTAVLALLGGLTGAAIGGALARIGSKRLAPTAIPGLGLGSEDLAANFWRDKGRAPFTSEPGAVGKFAQVPGDPQK
jgi:hypothetical protein